MTGEPEHVITCNAMWRDELPSVRCQRSRPVGGTHTGVHVYRNPETGKVEVAWWGPKPS